MLFIVNDKDFFEANPSAKAIPEFREVSSDEMKAICLLFDYKTPFKQLGYEKRMEETIRALKLGKTPTGRPSKTENTIRELRSKEIRDAKERFQAIQFDEDRDLLEAYDDYIKNVKKSMREAKDPMDLKRVADLAKDLPEIAEKKKRIADILNIRDEKERNQMQVEEYNHETSLLENILEDE